jgi:hypothetical protein
VVVGKEAYRFVTVSNDGAASETYDLAVTGSGFSIDSPTVTVFAKDGDTLGAAAVKVFFEPDATGALTGTLTFSKNAAVVKVVNLSGEGIVDYDGGTIAIDPSYIVENLDGDGEVTFEIDLSANTEFVYMSFLLQVSDGVVIDDVTTTSANTSGVNFAVDSVGDTMKVLSFLSVGDGITQGNAVNILTVTATVTDTSVQDVYDITISQATGTDVNGNYYEVTPQNGTIAVSNVVTVADLDVDDDGEVKTKDIIMIYRKLFLVDKYPTLGLSVLAEGMTLSDGGTGDDVVATIEELNDSLDVDEDGEVKTKDIIMIYRKLFLVDKYPTLGLSVLAEGMTLSGGVTEADVIKTIEAIVP